MTTSGGGLRDAGPPDPDFKKVIGAWMEKLSKNICPHCDAPIAQQEQVRRCVYARPCGHRLYQGTVGAFAPRKSSGVGGLSDQETPELGQGDV